MGGGRIFTEGYTEAFKGSEIRVCSNHDPGDRLGPQWKDQSFT